MGSRTIRSKTTRTMRWMTARRGRVWWTIWLLLIWRLRSPTLNLYLRGCLAWCLCPVVCALLCVRVRSRRFKGPVLRKLLHRSYLIILACCTKAKDACCTNHLRGAWCSNLRVHSRECIAAWQSALVQCTLSVYVMCFVCLCDTQFECDDKTKDLATWSLACTHCNLLSCQSSVMHLAVCRLS